MSASFQTRDPNQESDCSCWKYSVIVLVILVECKCRLRHVLRGGGPVLLEITFLILTDLFLWMKGNDPAGHTVTHLIRICGAMCSSKLWSVIGAGRPRPADSRSASVTTALARLHQSVVSLKMARLTSGSGFVIRLRLQDDKELFIQAG